MAITYKQKGGKAVSKDIVKIFEDAAKEFKVPVGLILGTCECESNFRLGLVSSANAVGPMQLKVKYCDDFYRYAGFKFDIESWDSVRGVAAILAYYAKKSKLESPNKWQWALCVFRWGQNSVYMKTYETCKRVRDVEEHMKRNMLWYDDIEEPAKISYPAIAKKAVEWALTKLGYSYSQPYRTREKFFDCSSLVARSYEAVGVSFEGGGLTKYPTSNMEVYNDNFELIWPATYSVIGKKFGSSTVIKKATQPGDIQYICTDASSTRTNKITHVVLVCNDKEIVHARGKKFGVVKTAIDLYEGRICAVSRYNPECELRKGMKGNRVLELQKKLNELGAGLKLDGDYGSATEKAVKKYGLA